MLTGRLIGMKRKEVLPVRLFPLLILIWGILLPFVANAQSVSSVEEIVSFYQNQAKEKPLHFWDISSYGWQQIILIRHGEPDLEKSGWKNRKQAEAFFRAYDSVGIRKFAGLPFESESLPADTVWHSNMPRAKHTAELLFGNTAVLMESEAFREFGRKVVPFINLKFPLKFWTITSRFCWLLGGNDAGIETFKEAKQRAKQNVGFLEGRALQHKNVVLVAHGLHNRFVAKYLRESGWRLAYSDGSGYGSVKILIKH